jgi:hypothetical protein
MIGIIAQAGKVTVGKKEAFVRLRDVQAPFKKENNKC